MKNFSIYKTKMFGRFATILLCMVLSLSSCMIKQRFDFLHDTGEIVKVELLCIGPFSNNPDSIVIRNTYCIEDIDAFVSDFENVNCYGRNMPGDYVNSCLFKISYANGDYQLVGAENTYSFEFRIGNIHNEWSQWFDEEQFSALIEKYAPSSNSGNIVVYDFIYPENEIEKIEMVDVTFSFDPYIPIEEVASIPINDITMFLKDFRGVECRQGGFVEWADLIGEKLRIIKATYKSGEYEYIDANGYLVHRSDYVTEQGYKYLSGTDCKCFNSDQFAALIEKYSP